MSKFSSGSMKNIFFLLAALGITYINAQIIQNGGLTTTAP